MNAVKTRMLKPHEGLKLHRMKRQLTNQVNSRHARIVLLSRGGLPNARIAERCDCTPPWGASGPAPLQRRRHRGDHVVSLLL